MVHLMRLLGLHVTKFSLILHHSVLKQIVQHKRVRQTPVSGKFRETAREILILHIMRKVILLNFFLINNIGDGSLVFF